MNKSLALLLLLSVAVVVGQNLAQWPNPAGSGWFAASPSGEACEPIHAEVYKSGKWKVATCGDIMEVLAAQRDVRQVTMSMAPTVADLLAYSQYEEAFRIRPADFRQAQKQCRKMLDEGYAHPDILAQCRQTVKGVVPYGLKLGEESK